MRVLLCCMMLLALAAPCMAGGCQDTQDAVAQAMKNRNGRVNNTHNVLVPDPEEDRDSYLSAIFSINAIGDAFSLGITLPNLEQLFGSACKQVNSMMQQKIHEAQNQLLNSVPDIGGFNPLKVTSNTDYVRPLTRKLK